MLKPEIKFQCESCHGIVLADLEDDLVNCGHCNAILNVPHKLGPGVVVDDFVLLKKIGTGGMGMVYLAHQFSLERECALKILMDHYVEEKHKNDFIIEARSVAKLNHLNIIKAYKVGVDNGIFFFAMELIEGDNLKDILRKKKTLTQDYVVRVAIEITRALGYAWQEEKLVHRDIKPDNIMIAKDGTAKLMDLGLCRPSNETQESSDIVSGTPQYISPEQILGATLDIRSDFYSLGATMYHLLTGKFIFNGSVDEMIDKHLDDKPNSLTTYKPTINPKLDTLILKLLSKKPENRHNDADALEKDLLQIQQNFKKTKKAAATGSSPSNKKGLSDIAQRDSKFQKKPLIIAISILSLFLLAAMVTLGVLYNSKVNAHTENTSTSKNEGVKDVFISESEMDEKNAPMHPDFIKSTNVTHELKKGLNYEYYQKLEMQSLNELETLKPIDQGKILLLDLDFRKRANYFAFVFKGFIDIPHTNTYTFTLKADDQCIIQIGNKKISADISNTQTASKKLILEKGIHPIEVRYLQRSGIMVLDLEVSSFRIKNQTLPYAWFKREDLPEQ